MKKTVLAVFLLAAFSILVNHSFAQSDIAIGTSYKLNLQRQTDNADAYILHNAKVDASSSQVFRWETTHSAFGSRGFRFNYSEGIHFFADAVATTSGTSFTPTTRFFIGNNGNVGIGTTPTPEARFTISQIGNGWNDGLRINRDASNYLTLTEDVTDIRLKNWGSGGIILFTSATEGLRILNNGNVGIGTSGPYAHSRLHVKSPSATPWGFMVEANANDKVMAMGHDGTTGYISTSYLASGGWSGIELRTQNTTRVNIASDGNVGIGTTSAPLAKLHVANGDLLLQNQSTGYPSMYLKDVAGTKVIKIDYNSVVGWGSKFYIRSGATGGNEALVLNDVGGNVGIGTANPNEKLTVNGTVYGTRVKVDLTVPGPDYVFEKEYKLPSLSEVESYIDQHKHLEEIPSAKEMEANGINVGEMNMLLLKKVEELTLYIIEQQKQINDLQKAIKKD